MMEWRATLLSLMDVRKCPSLPARLKLPIALKCHLPFFRNPLQTRPRRRRVTRRCDQG